MKNTCKPICPTCNFPEKWEDTPQAITPDTAPAAYGKSIMPVQHEHIKNNLTGKNLAIFCHFFSKKSLIINENQ